MKTIIKLIILLTISFQICAQSNLIYEAQDKKIQLTEEDQKVLRIGEIGTTQYVVGGVLGTYPLGFGIGHAIQGRWSEDGKIFTFGELGSAALFIGGALSCSTSVIKRGNCSDGSMTVAVAGLVGFVGFRIWEIVDVWAKPIVYNSRLKELTQFIKDKKVTLVPVIQPQASGLALSFQF